MPNQTDPQDVLMGQPFPVTDGYVLIMEPAYHSPVGSASSGLWSLQHGLEKNMLCLEPEDWKGLC